jgi:membrane protein
LGTAWNMKLRIFKIVRYVFYTFYTSITEGYAYHASALTYSFTMVLGSLLLFSSFFASFLPFFDFNKLINYTALLFPKQTEKVIFEIMKFYSHRTSGSVFSLILAYFFSVSFSKDLHKAFLYTLSEEQSEKEWAFWIKTPLVVIAYTLVISLFFIVSSLLKAYLGNHAVYLFYLINFFAIFSLTVIIYALFLPKKYTFTDVYPGAFFTSTCLLALNKVFSIFVVKFVKLNPLYGFMGSVLMFFIWINLSFTLILAGAKFIKLMKEEK